MRLCVSLGLCLFTFSVSAKIDLVQIEKDLSGTGITGWVHGAVHDSKMYVFTFRDPADFFSHAEFSLVPRNQAVRELLEKAVRHDEVQIQGLFLANPSPQKHILVTSLKVIAPYTPGGPALPARHSSINLADDLKGKTSLLATVHAVAGDGAVLVIEYKDTVVPVFVEEVALTRDLYRGDKIRVHFVFASHPKNPSHLQLNPAVKPAVEVLEKIVEQDGKPLTLEGPLVYFPKSPQLRFGVFALQTVDSNGLKLNHTLVNFEDPDAFNAIRKKLDALWKANEKTAVDGRNCWVNPKVRIRAEGIGNVSSPSQANPQILLESADSVNAVP